MPLDIALAWRRVQQDHRTSRVFATNPFEFGIVRSCEEQWLQRLSESLGDGSYRPSPAVVCDIPKSGGSIRPAALLDLSDQVVYTACVGAPLEAIRQHLSWATPAHDYAYQLGNTTGVDWLQSRFRCWEAFRMRSLESLDKGATAIVFTDITAFYDSVAIEIVLSDLRAAGIEQPALDLLARCLGRWAMVNGRGIPQGLSASDILAKLYMDVVDRAIAEAGFDHARYVDDIRVFCHSRAEAKHALLELSGVLRRRGLALQTAKTAILLPDQARRRIDGVAPTLQPLARKYVSEIARVVGMDPGYMSSAEAEQVIVRRGAVPPTALIEEVYKAYFLDVPDRFDRTLFHYLLNRLAAAGNPYAVQHVLSLLESYPQETQYILKYLRAVVDPRKVEADLLVFLTSADAVYSYQHYLVVRWRTLLNQLPTDDFASYVRRVLRNARTPLILRNAARAFLAKFGSPADLDGLADAYATAGSDLERAELLCSLYRVERGRRNAFLGTARQDGFLTAQAVQLVRDERVAGLVPYDGAA